MFFNRLSAVSSKFGFSIPDEPVPPLPADAGFWSKQANMAGGPVDATTRANAEMKPLGQEIIAEMRRMNTESSISRF
jgi:hypothetical protein